jgi:GTP pyrophosphokinase
MVSLKNVLQSGDTVEVLTGKLQRPNKDWLKIVKTSRAKAKIRQFIRTQERDRSISLGREILEREFRKNSLNLNKFAKDNVKLGEVLKQLHCSSIDDLYMNVGYGKITPNKVIKQIIPPEKESEEGEDKTILGGLLKGVRKKGKGSPIKLKGVDNVLISFAKCCNPVPGDPVVGFITRGRGVTIHSEDCQQLLDSDPLRRVEVTWDLAESLERHVKIKVISLDEPGLLVEMSKVLTSAGVNISQAQIRTTRDKKAINIFEITVHDLKHLRKIMNEMESLNGVISVERLRL